MAVPKKKTSKAKGRSRQAANWVLRRPPRSVCRTASRQDAARGVSELRVVQRAASRRGRLT